MWLRRQDELNEARPTERFSTAIRLLSGRAGMERRYAKGLEERSSEDRDDGSALDDQDAPAQPGRGVTDPDAVTDSVDVRAFAVSVSGPDTHTGRDRGAGAAQGAGSGGRGSGSRGSGGRGSGDRGSGSRADDEIRTRDGARTGGRTHTGGGTRTGDGTHADNGVRTRDGGHSGDAAGTGDEAAVTRTERPVASPRARRMGPSATERARRSKVLARRRRTTMVLFLVFTGGSVAAAIGGLAFLWAPGVPAFLLSAYIAYLRAQERRRFTFTMDQQRAEAAARRLREQRTRVAARPGLPAAESSVSRSGPLSAAGSGRAAPHTAGRRALVEQTDHAEWVDQQRERGPAEGASWEPVPVPLPTYVTAPVAPRATGSVDLDAPDAWSSARSGTVGPAAEAAEAAAAAEPGASSRRPQGRRARERGRTPLFDQYADDDRPRAANE
jgi:hypothetical protein